MLVYTLKGLCRTCYTCVRECPVNAIRIVGGQAEVIDERCIACGNFPKVCSSQGAKVFLNTTDVKKVVELYSGKITVESKPDVGTTFTVRLPKKSNNLT